MALLVTLCAAAALTQDAPLVVPFEWIKNEMVVPVELEGKGPYYAMVDTGASPCVIDLAVAKEIGLKLGDGGIGTGGGTQQKKYFETSLSQIRLADRRFDRLDAVAGDLSNIGKGLGRPISAILGDNLFEGRCVQFDYPHHVIRIASSASALRSPGSSAFTLEFKHEEHEVHLYGMLINGQSVVANLDTGANGTLSITPKGIERLQLQKLSKTGSAQQSSGFNGPFSLRKGTLQSVQLGPVRKESFPVGLWLPGTGHDHKKWDVNVGNGFLKEFVVTIDYVKNQVTFERGS